MFRNLQAALQLQRAAALERELDPVGIDQPQHVALPRVDLAGVEFLGDAKHRCTFVQQVDHAEIRNAAAAVEAAIGIETDHALVRAIDRPRRRLVAQAIAPAHRIAQRQSRCGETRGNQQGGDEFCHVAGPTAKATRFGVRGGHKGDGFYPPPADGSAKMDDPYASLPFPAYDDCPNGKGINMTDIKNNRRLKPGTYCYGIHVYGGAQVTMEPGVYVMWNGPFWVNGGATVTGDQVTIAFTGKGSTLQVWGNSSVNLTSPTSGTYMNMQFMQDWNDTQTRNLWASVGGSDGNDTGDGSKLSYDGVAYFPTQNFWMFGNSIVNANSPSMAIVADKIWTQGSADVKITNLNPRNLPVTNVPSIITGVVLVR